MKGEKNGSYEGSEKRGDTENSTESGGFVCGEASQAR